MKRKKRSAKVVPSAGAVPVPTDEFYGDRVFMFIDPDGYEWKVLQTIRDVSVAEVKKAVSRN